MPAIISPVKNAETLKTMIVTFLSEVNQSLEIENLSNEGRSELLTEEIHEAFRSNDSDKAALLMAEIARVAQAGGYTRGRFELVSRLVEIIQRWDRLD